MTTLQIAKVIIVLFAALALILLLCIFELSKEVRWYKKLFKKQPYVYTLPYRRSAFTRAITSLLNLSIVE